ncbi:MAG: nucleoside kinase, partial [Tenuifilaceae bacterium]|nr:nucleoside kinase [Tenuifilaceae bacterium]
MRKEVEIICENINERKRIKPGQNLLEISKQLNITLNHQILGAMVNNELKELKYEVYSPKSIRFIDITHPDGMRMYQRSLFFILQKAIDDVMPGARVQIKHSVSKGFYCDIEGITDSIEYPLIFSIVDKMREIVAQDLPIRRDKVLTKDAINMFAKSGNLEKASLFKTRSKLYTSIYYINGTADYFYGPLVPSTGYLKAFDLVKYYQGMLLMIPKQSNPTELEDIVLQDKMFEIFREYSDWTEILGFSTVS